MTVPAPSPCCRTRRVYGFVTSFTREGVVTEEIRACTSCSLFSFTGRTLKEDYDVELVPDSSSPQTHVQKGPQV